MLENIRLSLKGILSHKMRSVLTMLGIIIGISSIIIIVSIIQGTSDMLKQSMVGSSDNTISIDLYSKEDIYSPYDTSYSGKVDGIAELSSDSIEEVKALDTVVTATPVYSKQYSLTTSYNGTNSDGSVYGIEKDYFSVVDLTLKSGRLFTERDYTNRSNVAVISQTRASELFGTEEPLGKTITVGKEMFIVVGVVTRNVDYSDINSLSDYNTKIGSSSGGVYIPSTAWSLVAGYDDIQSLVVKIASVDDTVAVGTAAASILNSYLTNENYEYKSGTLNEDAAYLEQITMVISILLIGIASISLLVGGIGVMNIMLVSVTERTREIGLKKALGAKRRVILSQFLTEAVVLTSLGGVFGVLIGIGISYLVGMIISMPISISITSIAISVAFSMGVGIIFGLVPSIRASKLDPIEALRYE